MNIKQLKNKVLKNTLNNETIIFKYIDNKILPKMYYEKIAKDKKLSIKYVDSIYECNDSSDIFTEDVIDTNLYILSADKFTVKDYKIAQCEALEFIKRFNNLIIICKECDKELESICITFPKLEDWQVIDYLKVQCPGVPQDALKWLYDITKSDIHRTLEEANKIAIFNKSEQASMFNQINNENGYSDLNNFNIFNLTTAILKKDLVTISDILESFENVDIEPVGLVTILYKNFKNVISVKLNSKATPQSSGLTDKQFNGVKYSTVNFTTEEIIKTYEFLSELDYKLKNGDASAISGDKLKFVQYIICSILS